MDIIEGHPIPQDITGFQFRIIGDLTIKQFAYLALGLLLGWIFIAVSLPFFIKIPLAVFFAGSGILLAFIPIQGRPADVMLSLFFKAVLRPNDYVYDKHSPLPSPTNATPAVQTSSTTVVQTPVVSATHATPPQAAPQPIPLQDQIETLTTQLKEAKQEEEHQTNAPSAEKAHEKVITLESQLSQVMTEKEELEKQLTALQQQLQQKQEQVFTPSEPVEKAPTDHVKKIEQSMKTATGAPVGPDAPNLVLGVIKDPRGNVLPNILIEVKDKSGNAVRAFKTNTLGQFASATPLLTGTYTIHFEDPKGQQQFDTVEIQADGSILNPLEIISTDERENLRKSLFGG